MIVWLVSVFTEPPAGVWIWPVTSVADLEWFQMDPDRTFFVGRDPDLGPDSDFTYLG